MATRGGGGLQWHTMRWCRRQCGINLGAEGGGYTAFECGCSHCSPRCSAHVSPVSTTYDKCLVSNSGNNDDKVGHTQWQGNAGGQGQRWMREEGLIWEEEEAKIAAA
jgi:hypothetical protein